MRFRAVLILAGMALGGCSLSGMVQSDSVDYTQTYDAVTNIGLVTNILRARDHAPLNFSALSDIRTGITASAAVGTSWPIGPIAHALTRGADTSMLSVAINPSFEIAPIDTQDFTRGILTPVDPIVVKYYLDREIPQKLLMYLFFDRIVVSLPSAPSPSTAGATPGNVVVGEYVNDPTQPAAFEKFAAFVDKVFEGAPNDLHVVNANRYTPLQPVGPPFPFSPGKDTLKDLATIDPAKNRVFYDPQKKLIQLYAVAQQPEVIFCRDNVPVPMLGLPGEIHLAPQLLPPNASSLGAAARSKLQKEIDADNAAAAKFFAELRDTEKGVCTSDMAKMTIGGQSGVATFGTIYLRSVEGIIQYLGALVRDAPGAEIARRHLKYDLMALSENEKPSRFGVTYYDRTYYVKDTAGDDRSLQVLALLSQLLNLNKVAKEIPTTRAVEIVP